MSNSAVAKLRGLPVFHTQIFEIKKAAPTQHRQDAMNGQVRVPEYVTRTSPNTPEAMATMQLSVVMLPNTVLSSRPLVCRPCSWYVEIIQASNTLNSNVVETPPVRRPKNSTSKLSLSMVRQVIMYKPQYTNVLHFESASVLILRHHQLEVL